MNAATDRAAARVGSVLKGKWRLDELIGVGGMAAVYAATHRNGKRVAVKLLHPEISLDENIRKRFLREGYVANAVGHRGAVAVDDDDVAEDGSAFLVMELLQGETLDGRAQRNGGRLPPDEVLALLDQVLDTLAAAHERGIVHRDLKPENIFLTQEGAVKVLDFGIARIRELSGHSQATQTGALLGTPVFMPPEQARSRWDEVDARTDIWAIGATMFTLLTGRFVHEAETLTEALALAVTARARSIGTVDPTLAPPVVALIDRALAYDKAERWPDAAAMQEALRETYHSRRGTPESDVRERLSSPEPASGFDAPTEPIEPAERPALPEPRVDGTLARSGVSVEASPRDSQRLRHGRLAVIAMAAVVLLLGVAAFLRGHRSDQGEPSSGTAAVSVTPALPLSESALQPATADTNTPVPARVVPVEAPSPATMKSDGRGKTEPPAVASASGDTRPVDSPRREVKAVPVQLVDEEATPTKPSTPTRRPRDRAVDNAFSGRF